MFSDSQPIIQGRFDGDETNPEPIDRRHDTIGGCGESDP